MLQVKKDFPHWRMQLAGADDYKQTVTLPPLPDGVQPAPVIFPDAHKLGDEEATKVLEQWKIKNDGSCPSLQQFREMEHMMNALKDKGWRDWLHKLLCHDAADDTKEQHWGFANAMKEQYEKIMACRPPERHNDLVFDKHLWIGNKQAEQTMPDFWISRLVKHGWHQRIDNGRSIYTHPDCPDKARLDGKEGIDYFYRLDDVQAYVTFHRPDWKFPAEASPSRIFKYSCDRDLERFRHTLEQKNGLYEMAQSLISTSSHVNEPTEDVKEHLLRAAHQTPDLTLPGAVVALQRVNDICSCCPDQDPGISAYAGRRCHCSARVYYWKDEGEGIFWIHFTCCSVADVLNQLSVGSAYVTSVALRIAPKHLYVRIPLHYYKTKMGTITKVRHIPAPGDCYMEGLDAKNRRQLIPRDWIDSAVSATGVPLDAKLRAELHRHVADSSKKHFHGIPAGAAKRNKKRAREDEDFRMPHPMQPSHYTCYPTAAASTMQIHAVTVGNTSLKECAAHIAQSGSLLAKGGDSNRKVTDFIIDTLRCTGYSYRPMESFDPTAPAREHPVIARLKSDRAFPHCVGFLHDKIVDPAEERTMPRSRNAINGICGGQGAFIGVDWAYEMTPVSNPNGQCEVSGIFSALSACLRVHGLVGLARDFSLPPWRSQHMLSPQEQKNRVNLRKLGITLRSVRHAKLRMVLAGKKFFPSSDHYRVAVAEVHKQPGLFVSFTGSQCLMPPYKTTHDISKENLSSIAPDGFSWSLLIK